MAHTKTATIYVGSGDGYLSKRLSEASTQTKWDTLHNATSADDAENLISASAYQNPYVVDINRAFLPFDTSSLDNGAVVSATTFLLKVSGSSEYKGSDDFGVVQTSQASPTTLALADYDNCGNTHSPTEGATRISIAGNESVWDTWVTFTLNATGLSWIDPTGYTKLGIRHATDLDDTYNGDIGWGMWFYGYADGTAKKPYLTITYTISRYWVGGTGNWSDTAHWAYSSGGAGGASVPDADMDVYFDANSFSGAGQTCTINTAASIYSLALTGVTNAPTFAGSSDLTIATAFTTVAGITWSHTGSIILNSTTGGTFTSNSIDFSAATLKFNGAGSTWTLGDALSISTGTLNLVQGTLNTNEQAVTIKNLDSSNANTRIITCGASAFTVTGDWDLTTTTNLTYTTGTSTITLSGNNTYFNGGGKTYNSVTLTGTPITVTGSNTITTLALTAAKQLNLTAGTTQTVTTFTATGTTGNLITIRSTTAGTAATISKSSGTVTCDFLDLQDSTVSGGATWKPGDNSTDSGNNAGWSQAWTNPTNAYASDNTYATHTSPTGKLYVKVSKDGGATWTSTEYITFTGVEGSQDLGDGATELWGTSFSGANITDANFKVKIYANSETSFNSQIYGTSNLDDDISAGAVITGIKISVEGKWDGTTMSLDFISAVGYYGNSPMEIAEGSITADSTLHLPSMYTGSAWETLVGISAIQTLTNKTLTTPTLTVPKIDHIAEATGSHGIVFDNDITRVGKLSIDHIAEATGAHNIVLDNNLTSAGDISAATFNGDALTRYVPLTPAVVVVSNADPADTNFANVDVTANTSATCYAVALQTAHLSATVDRALYIRKNGDTTAAGLVNDVGTNNVAARYGFHHFTVGVDTNQIFQYAVNNADVSSVYIWLHGYWETTT